jgi:tight adherence protein B
MSRLGLTALLVPLLAVALWWWRGRAARLSRLRQLVQVKAPHLKPVSAGASPVLQRFMPPALMRDLHLVGIEPDGKDVGIFLAVASLPVIVAGFFFGAIAALALAGAMGIALYAALNLVAARRLAELATLMPGFFERVRQLLAVGNSLPTAFGRAVQGAQPRLVHFFAPALRRIGNGASFSESIRQTATDIDLYEIRLFATAVATNMRFGGSLSHSLTNLIAYLRKRSSIERELRANTAQIRASAWVLGLLPMMVGGLILVQNRDYARWFLVHPTGRHMLIYCAVSQIAGAVLMRIVVRTKF